MALTHDHLAAREFFEKVSELCSKATPYTAGIVMHTVTPDESFDVTLISRRVYGNSNEVLAIMAAAGMSHFDDKLRSGRVILLPSSSALINIKRLTGYESQSDLIDAGKPVWAAE